MNTSKAQLFILFLARTALNTAFRIIYPFLPSIARGLLSRRRMGTTLLTDRLGKQRSILLGLCGLAASLAMLPWPTCLGIVAALGGVALMMLTFEFTIVSVVQKILYFPIP